MPPKSKKPAGGKPKGPPSYNVHKDPHPQSQIGFLPPGTTHPAVSSGHHAGGKGGGKGPRRDPKNDFEYRFEEDVPVPARLTGVPFSLVSAVNDFHFAMMNDTPRNEFYYQLLEKHIVPGETTVLEIGAGSGLLSMMAAKLGARWVVAVEGSAEMAALARENIRRNGFDKIVTVKNMLSTDLKLSQLPARPDVLVSEIFGTMLLGESALDYIADVRARILKPDTVILPQRGVQYAVPIECPTLSQICAVHSWNGIDLSDVMALQDTVSTVFTKQYGFRMSSVPYRTLAEPIALLDIDFTRNTRGDFDKVLPLSVTATADGTAHAWLYYWEATNEDGSVRMSTRPEDTRDNFPRDMQWGQALQLIDTFADQRMPTTLVVQKGQAYNFNCTFSFDRVVAHIAFRPGPADAQSDAADSAPQTKLENEADKKE